MSPKSEKASGLNPPGAGAAALQAGVAEAVVGGPFLPVAEHAIGFGGFLEPLLRVGIVGVAVGVVLQRLLAVGALDLRVARALANTKNFVIISFCHWI